MASAHTQDLADRWFAGTDRCRSRIATACVELETNSICRGELMGSRAAPVRKAGAGMRQGSCARSL